MVGPPTTVVPTGNHGLQKYFEIRCYNMTLQARRKLLNLGGGEELQMFTYINVPKT